MRIFPPWLDRLTIKFAGGVALIVVTTLTVGLYMVSSHHYQSLLDASRREALRRGELVRMALEHQMMEDHQSPLPSHGLLARMVDSFASQRELQRVLVLDREGQVKISSDPAMMGVRISQDSPTCKVCHSRPPSERLRSALLDSDDGTLLRAVQPIYNQPRCRECHDPSNRINGIVIVDVTTVEIRAEIARDRHRMLAVAGGLCLFLLAGIGLLMRDLVLRRLHRLVEASRALGAGDLDRRVSVTGNDALTTVAVEFNAMADALRRLVGEVGAHHKRLQHVMDSVDDGMVVLDSGLCIRAFNEAFARRFRLDASGMSNRPCHSIIGIPLGCQRGCADDCPARRCFATGALQRAFRTRNAIDGEERLEEVYVSPVYGESGEVEQVVEVWRDITDRRSTEARMAEFDRLASLGMLASGFSHEVNTPLGSMLACIEAILKALEDPGTDEARAEMNEYARVIHSEILRCKGITRQFLQLSRGERIAAGLLDVNEVARSVMPIVAPTARAAGVSVAFEPSAGISRAIASNGAVQQVLLNLVMNAIQASARGSTVTVRCRLDERVWMIVEDQGHGIPKGDRKKIFEPFYSTRSGGTGLGLFVSVALARNWGGDVRVDSEEGRGSTFAVSFPVVRDDDERCETAAG